MRGYSHSLSGAAAGLAAGILLHYSLTNDAALSGLTAGMALLPDLDTRSSCASRCLGFASGAVSLVIAKTSGGHRHLAHSLAGIAAFTGLAWLACHYRHDLGGKIGLGLLLVIAVAGALEALHLARSHAADLAGAVVAGLVIWHGYGLALIPLATLIGTSTHILGDMLTVEGCPLVLPLSKSHQFALPPFLRFTTSHWPETRIVDPVLLVSFVLLASWAVMPGADMAAFHAVVHAL